MLWVVQEAVYDVGKGEEEGEVTVGIKGVPEKNIDEKDGDTDVIAKRTNVADFTKGGRGRTVGLKGVPCEEYIVVNHNRGHPY